MTITRSRTGIKRGQAAALLNCNAETIRYYETAGLITEPARTAAGHRVYCENDIARLRFILKLRELGFSIGDVKSLIAISDAETPNCKDVAAIGDRHLSDIQRKIKDLQSLEHALSDLVNLCDHDQESGSCALIDAVSEH